MGWDASATQTATEGQLLFDAVRQQHARWLAKESTTREYEGASSMNLDYTVLSVAFVTLALILLVEILRHKIDQRAHGRPFAKTVLEGVYRELSTLGIVEFALFLFQTYMPNFDVKIYKVFAKVHFLLFFTAIINAVFAVLLAVVASRLTTRTWVQTEELELNHYIAIREEFDRVEAKLSKFTGSRPLEDTQAEHVHSLSQSDLKWTWTHLVQVLRYPFLKRKYERLLVQVRFHELRVHFLQANNLPLQFKVSDYLVRSETHVLKKMVHISTFAWIAIAAAVNLLYFLMGMVAYASESKEVVGKTMSWILVGVCIAFVPVSYVIFNKMKHIFSQIMQMKLIDYAAADDESSADSESISAGSFDGEGNNDHGAAAHRHAVDQLGLFWGANPEIIIVSFQAMQLGYAIAASSLLIFWEPIDEMVNAKWVTVAILTSYVMFLMIVGRVIPRYTLCTSLGQMVNRRRLHEAVAKYNLDETRRRRRRQHEEQELKAAMFEETERNAAKNLTLSTRRADNIHFEPPLPSKQMSLQLPKKIQGQDRASSTSSDPEERIIKLAELVQTSTKELPSLTPSNSAQKANQRSSKRTKSVSDGVAFMRDVPGVSNTVASVLDLEDSKQLFQPGAGQLSRGSITLDRPDFKAAAAGLDLLPSAVKGGRRRRKRSASDNVALMRSPTASSMFASVDSSTPNKAERPIRTSSSSDALHTLIEGIPSRSIKAEELCSEINLSSDLGKETDPPSAMLDVMKEGKRDDDEESDGGRSDFDDVPDATTSMKSVRMTEGSAVSFMDKLHSFFLSKKYRLLSGVLGTMVAFFIVGMRVEALLIASAALEDTENTWHIENISGIFWWEVSWLCMLCFVSWVRLLFFRPQWRDHFHIIIADCTDILLCMACLLFLIWAEDLRCCQYGSACCAAFGSRTYGGLGNIEPLTSLVALRALTFQFGHFVERSLCSRLSKNVQEELADGNGELSTPNKAFEGHGTEAKSLGSETGTIVELWKTATALFPEVVKIYGEFSGELLQAMLGIKIVEERDIEDCSPAALTLSTRHLSQHPDADPVPELEKLQKNVRTTTDCVIGSDGTRMGIATSPSREGTLKSMSPPTPTRLEMRESENDGDNNEASSFIIMEPDATLIRSMRRCERRLPPVLNHWAVVDVVLTKFELVCFDASGVGDSGDTAHSDAMHRKMHAVRRALTATKGGKGLRLCDVAIGRKVVGHLNLSDIDFTKVERYFPAKDGDAREVDHISPVNTGGLDVTENRRSDAVQVEYWQSPGLQNSTAPMPGAYAGEYDAPSRNRRWRHVVEDRLKVHSKQGALFLRFFSDLEEWVPSPTIEKNDSILWCQTITRLCGTEQLHQRLPHFGEKGKAELEDLIEVHARHHNDDTHNMWKIIHKKAHVPHRFSKARRPTSPLRQRSGVHGGEGGTPKPLADKEDKEDGDTAWVANDLA